MSDPASNTTDETIQNLYRAGDGVGTISDDLSIPIEDVWGALYRGRMDSYHGEGESSHG